MVRRILSVVAMACWACGDPTISDAEGVGSSGAGGSHSAAPSAPRTDFAFPDAGPSVTSAGAPPGQPGISPDFKACAAKTFKAERVPLDLFFLVDLSGSMQFAVTQGGPSKWLAERDAIEAFVKDPRSAGLGIGVQFFPVPRQECTTDGQCPTGTACAVTKSCSGVPGSNGVRGGCTGQAICATGICALRGLCYGADGVIKGSCTMNGNECSPGNTCRLLTSYCAQPSGAAACEASRYSKPAFATAVLPAATTALLETLRGVEPNGGTPMGAGILGAFEYLQARAKADPRRRAALVLFSDGVPTQCSPNTIATIAPLLQAANAGSPPVPTFVLGAVSAIERPRLEPALNQLATAGGSKAAIVVETNQDTTRKLTDALTRIRGEALPCDFPIPAGATLDYANVNVSVVRGQGAPMVIPNVAGAPRCMAPTGGWYFDVDPKAGTPTSIVACPATCAALKAAPDAQVNVLVGCRTVYIP